ncbi:MAG: type VI secretion system protein TssA [Rhodobacteraceae bacterium]|nr:type VI secretion system protein TssA [Paracoccaceae bacterium]
MDPTVLLQARSEDSPSGENLEYDPTFTEMELAAQPGEERQIGDEIIEAEDPDYGEVRIKALEVLERSHDLRAAVFLADAVIQSEGIAGFVGVTTYIRGCLEEYWETCHPELDEDDDNDPTMRINAIQGLCGQPDDQAGPSPVFRSLRSAALTDSRSFGGMSLRDMEIADGQIPTPASMTNVPDTATISAALRDTDKDTLTATMSAVALASENVKAISAAFDEHTPGQGPDLSPLLKLLAKMTRPIGEQIGTEVVDLGEDDDTMLDSDEAVVRSAGGGINSPSDVSNALDRIISYYGRAEPSSPIPILLVRAKRLVNADFLTIMQDMAPQGIDNVHLIGGIDDDD